jgi:fibronectin type 3 domain-containing protein
LRADAPGDTLRPLTPEAIRDASFSDPNVKPGVQYEYAVVAIDRNGNTSTPSPRLGVTAR